MQTIEVVAEQIAEAGMPVVGMFAAEMHAVERTPVAAVGTAAELPGLEFAGPAACSLRNRCL